MWPLESAVQAEGSFAFNRIDDLAARFASPSLSGSADSPARSCTEERSPGARSVIIVRSVEIGGERPCEHPHGVRRYGCVWFVPILHSTDEPYPFLLRLHKSNQRHVGGPCEVIGLAMAKTRRLHPSWLHVSHGLSIFDFQAPDSLHITPRRPLPSIPRGRSCQHSWKGRRTFQRTKHPPLGGEGGSREKLTLYLA